jgi:hypothetical protein
VLFLSTIASSNTIVVRNRKRPSSTSTSAKTARKPFGSESRKDLPIPDFVDGYNHNMNHVDIADQLRSTNPGNRRIRRGGWHALWNFLFYVTIVNCHALSDYKSASRFRVDLQASLLERSQVLKKRKRSEAFPEAFLELEPSSHKLESGQQLQYCSVCNQTPGYQRNRPVLGVISPNCRSTAAQKRKKTTYGCGPCREPVCKDGNCFKLHCN